MKKSEMVKALMEKFNHVFIGVHAEPIIDFLVEQGMIPPDHERVQYVKSQKNTGTLRLKVKFYEWEPEDEKK
jgi:hypothetical protein